TFDGTVAGGTEHELIDGVDNMQLRYGRDTTTPAPDGIVDDYVSAREVSDWSRVVTVRMSLLLRSAEPLAGVSTAASAVVNGVTVAFPDTRHDRRVFTTTVAVRNRTSYF
ncbi:MAG TPA: PilW family protein, partial [Gemmatimonadales bacterium]|nr:PilW family protein [Gemmatimonadales bacterium]